MASSHKSLDGQHVPSKHMAPLPDNFGPVFFRNQFRTKIDLPTKQKYPDVKGKCAIVTGSNTGLGFEAAKQLLSLGLSHLVMAVRSLERGKAAATELIATNSSAKIEVWQLDMESYDSIQAFVRRCQDGLPRIHIVILNAGLSPMTFATVPATGHEKAIQVNHISTALLAILMLPVLKRNSVDQIPPRITIVNSATAHLCKFPNKDKRPLLPSFDDTAVTPWNAEERYGVSKLLSQLFVVKLAENVSPEDIVINMVDPGLTKGTGLSRDARGGIAIAAKVFFSVAGRPVNRGAATYVDAVLGQGKESHGCFLMNCKISPLARWFYTDGKVLTDLIWTETLQELSFAGAEDIIASIKST
ncbi:Fc.00g054890.m01.CDS01 [Cosmosporella sp. VM-42]